MARTTLGALLLLLSLVANAQEIDPAIVDAARRLDDNVRAEESIFFEVELSRESVYVQAELVVTRRVLYANNVQLFNDLPKSPTIENTLVLSHGNPRQLKYFRNGIEYKALEHRFSVFADASGSLTIPAIEIRANIRLDDRRRPRMVRIESPVRTVDIMPIPDAYPANSPWLAAESLRLTDEWLPNEQAYEVGTSISRLLTVEATGVVGSTIPPLFVQTPSNLKRYDDPVELDEYVEDGIVRGTRIEQQTLVPVRPGAILSPSVEIVWWNTTTDRLATSVVPVRRFNVIGALATTDAVPNPPTEIPSDAAEDRPTDFVWPTIAFVGWGLFAASLAVMWRSRRIPSPAETPAPKNVESLARNLPSDPARARAEIIKAMCQRYDVSRAELMRLLSQHDAGVGLLKTLDSSLYAEERTTYDRDGVRRLFLSAIDVLDAPSGDDALPPLFPAPSR